MIKKQNVFSRNRNKKRKHKRKTQITRTINKRRVLGITKKKKWKKLKTFKSLSEV